jgi:hypothetical protein
MWKAILEAFGFSADKTPAPSGLSRRRFLQTIGVTAATVALPGRAFQELVQPENTLAWSYLPAPDPNQILNEQLFRMLGDPRYSQRAVDAVNDFTRMRMREDGFFRRIVPPLPLNPVAMGIDFSDKLDELTFTVVKHSDDHLHVIATGQIPQALYQSYDKQLPKPEQAVLQGRGSLTGFNSFGQQLVTRPTELTIEPAGMPLKNATERAKLLTQLASNDDERRVASWFWNNVRKTPAGV